MIFSRNRKPLWDILKEATAAHYKREGVDPARLVQPISDQLERVHRMDGDTEQPKRGVFVEGL